MSRILFIAEAVTLAHAARSVVLATGLRGRGHQVTLAWSPRYAHLFPGLALPVREIHSVTSERFLRALASGSPLYDARTLEGYVDEDLATLRAERPDVVVGDFRLSLAVSARLERVPYVTVTNAYWSPYAPDRFPVPDLPVSRLLGPALGQALFNGVRPLAFAYHAVPLNRVMRRRGLKPLGLNLRRVYTEADRVAYADLPELFPEVRPPADHQFLGPVLWSPPIARPAWWESLPADRPLVYVTLGSSGRAELLPRVLEGLAGLPVTVVAATAGRVRLDRVPENARVADYLPGEEAVARARLVVCNGGSPSTQQALAGGVPVLGIATNLDQHLNMRALANAGAGLTLRSDRLRSRAVAQAAARLLSEPSFRDAADRLGRLGAQYDPVARLAGLVEGLLSGRAPSTGSGASGPDAGSASRSRSSG